MEEAKPEAISVAEEDKPVRSLFSIAISIAAVVLIIALIIVGYYNYPQSNQDTATPAPIEQPCLEGEADMATEVFTFVFEPVVDEVQDDAADVGADAAGSVKAKSEASMKRTEGSMKRTEGSMKSRVKSVKAGSGLYGFIFGTRFRCAVSIATLTVFVLIAVAAVAFTIYYNDACQQQEILIREDPEIAQETIVEPVVDNVDGDAQTEEAFGRLPGWFYGLVGFFYAVTFYMCVIRPLL